MEPSPTTERIDRLVEKIDGLIGPKPASVDVPLEKATAQAFKPTRPALGVSCPNCNKRALRRAKRDSIVDYVALLVLFAPYRCRYCRYFEMRFLLEGVLTNKR